MFKAWIPAFAGMTCLMFLPHPIHGKTPLPTNVTVLSRADLIGHNYYSVADALSTVPFLNIQKETYRGSRAVAKIRGVSSERRVLVLMDGRPLTHEFDGSVDLSQIPVNTAERIEITRGGSSLSYGAEASGGVINIITAKPYSKGMVAQLGTGVGRDGVKNSAGQIMGRSYWGDLTYLGSLQKSSGWMTNEEIDEMSHFVKMTRSFNGKGHWGAEYYYQESETGLPEGTSVPFEEWNRKFERQANDENRFKKENSQHFKGFLVSPEWKESTFHLDFTQSMREREDFDLKNDPATKDRDSRTTKVDLKWRRGGFELGLDKKDFDRQIFPHDSHQTHQNGAYLLQKFHNEDWTVLPALRIENHSNFDEIITPRLVIVSHPNSHFLLSTTLQKAFTVPTFDEFFLGEGGTQANPDLNPEKSWSYDAGFRLTHSTNTYAGPLRILQSNPRPDSNRPRHKSIFEFRPRGEFRR